MRVKWTLIVMILTTALVTRASGSPTQAKFVATDPELRQIAAALERCGTATAKVNVSSFNIRYSNGKLIEDWKNVVIKRIEIAKGLTAALSRKQTLADAFNLAINLEGINASMDSLETLVSAPSVKASESLLDERRQLVGFMNRYEEITTENMKRADSMIDADAKQ